MPMYDFKDTNTGESFSLELTIAKREEYLKENPHITQILGAPSLVRGTNYGGKMDDGWKENLARISEAHPNSALAEKQGGRSATRAKVSEIATKHGLNKRGKYNMDL